MHVMEQLVNERARSNRELAEQLRHSRSLRKLHQASRLEHKAERRMIEAWRRAAELRSSVDCANY